VEYEKVTFSYLARLLAILGVVIGVLRILLGLSIAHEWLGPYRESLSRYAPNATSSGEIIDKGVYTILIAVALGTLAEIGITVRKHFDKI
jgi:hypothetical protein